MFAPTPDMQSPPLDSGEIHVWTATLTADGEALTHHRALLADDERARADRFLPSRVRERFIVARAILRRLLSVYVRSDPSALRFGYADNGKPYLAHGSGTESAEPPFVGTDLGDEFDESVVLAPGMVMVLEPVIWDDGDGGFRAEQMIAITQDGWTSLSDLTWDGWE